MDIAQASLKTAADLRTVAQLSQLSVPEVSRLTLPELEAVVEQVARLVPAGNIPGLILSGLARLPNHRLPAQTVRRDLRLLFQGAEQTLDKAVFAAFFAGPAAVIGAYQGLLKLAGKDPAAAFPEGTWQFYVEYAMREDTARHATETHGFDSFLRRRQLQLSAADRATAWVMAACYCLHQYDSLLANEWRERVYTRLLAEVMRGQPDAARYAQLYARWQKQRPYNRELTSHQPYPVVRRHAFDQFLAEPLAGLAAARRSDWQQRVDQAEAEDLPAYQRQMSILAYLAPGRYSETRALLPLGQAAIGLIWQGCYYLIPACLPGSTRPADPQAVRAMIAAVFDGTCPAAGSALLPELAHIKRTAWPDLRRSLTPELVEQLDRLRQAPIWLNCDSHPRRLPLAELRQSARSRGDHALTLFDTGDTMVFDQSHIFFDGAWGAALAEIMTGEAIHWANRLHSSPAAHSPQRWPQVLIFSPQPADLTALVQAPRLAAEVGAESDAVNLKAMLRLRRLFKQRSEALQLTVNDLLLLVRAIHALTYSPPPALQQELEALLASDDTRPAAQATLEALAHAANPTIVIPFDASTTDPRERLYPITFEAPLTELDFLSLHQAVWAACQRGETGAEFDRLRRDYLATLAGFGQLLSRAKQIARAGESMSVGAMKLLAHMPVPLQRLLEQVPERFELLNDMLKGREVFSNVGAVAPGSTLTRFISAKDDNDKKTLVWGVITTAQEVMQLSLRDFRPHVEALAACGRRDLAVRIAQDYLDAYAGQVNQFVRQVDKITRITPPP
ncbi:MAG: hypothetical protein FOGNACKC_04082 [Anaerolineae bacterium]|nr:hypothetical protein [Anaerolineae bacterium]